MRRSSTLISVVILLTQALTVPPTSLGYSASAPMRVHWPQRTIKVALSTSLSSPGPNIKLGSDVVGAARRALLRWSDVTNLKFVVSESSAQSISATNDGDGISLITVADTPQNNAIFGSGEMAARTRVFYDQESGTISEADVVINPHPVSTEGAPVQFSTDGTPGTFDLESTFAHEIGHLLGLEHSPVLSATMNERLALNGPYNHFALIERTLSEDDRANVRRNYGASQNAAVEGRMIKQTPGGLKTPVSGLQLWLEENSSGRLIADVVSAADGSYRVGNLEAGTYRLIAGGLGGSRVPEVLPLSGASSLNEVQAERVAEVGAPIVLPANETQSIDLVVPTQLGPNRFLNPKLLGTNKELSSVAIPAAAGSTLTIYIGGEGVDQVPANGVTITSPFFTVNPLTVKTESYGASFPVISFQITVAQNVPFGDYSIRLQSNTGESAYLPGALTVDPGVESIYANPADDPRFFLKQQYHDVLGREADSAGLEYWVAQLEQCGKDADCVRSRRINIAAAFLGEAESQRKATFIYELYHLGLRRRPVFSEFIAARDQLGDLAKNDELKLAVAQALVQRPEFLKLYPTVMKAEDFVDSLLNGIVQNTGIDLSADRAQLLKIYADGSDGRAAVLHRLALNEQLSKVESDRVFVLMQYFGYLLRDPDEAGYRFWLNSLENRNQSDPGRYAPMICAFLSSNEYQSRFGMMMTHSSSECGR